MVNDVRFLDMKDAALYLGQSVRWMRRNYIELVRSGVEVYRFPKDSKRGHLFFAKVSLERYIAACRIKGEFGL
jgi:hypothetical protein